MLFQFLLWNINTVQNFFLVICSLTQMFLNNSQIRFSTELESRTLQHNFHFSHGFKKKTFAVDFSLCLYLQHRLHLGRGPQARPLRVPARGLIRSTSSLVSFDGSGFDGSLAGQLPGHKACASIDDCCDVFPMNSAKTGSHTRWYASGTFPAPCWGSWPFGY